MRRRFPAALCSAALCLSLALVGCPRANTGSARVYVSLGAALSESAITSVVVTITCPGTSQAIIAPLTESAGDWTTVIGGIPASATNPCTFTANAYQDTTLLYTGSAQRDVLANTTIAVLIYAQSVTPPPNQTDHAPIIDSISVSPINPTPGTNVTLLAAAHDLDANETAQLVYSWADAQGAVNFTPATGAQVTWQAPDGTTGPASITLTVTDPLGAYAADTFVINVQPAAVVGTVDAFVSLNTWPIITSVIASPGQLDVGSQTQLTSTGYDADGDPLTFEWTTDCIGTFSPSAVGQNPTFSPTQVPTNAVNGVGTCTLTVNTNDGRGGSNTGSLVISVGPLPTAAVAPVIDSAYQSATASFEGEAVQFVVNAHDPNGGSLTYNWLIDDPRGGFTPNNTAAAATTTLSIPALCNGVHLITLSVTNSANLSTSQTFNVASCPVSCDQLYDAEPSYQGGAGSGNYYVDPAQLPYPVAQDSDESSAVGTQPFLVYCDMTDGGWTLIGKIGDSLVSKPSDFTSDLLTEANGDVHDPSNYGPGSMQYSHLNLNRFNAYGTNWTVKTVTDTYQADSPTQEHYQYSYWRPQLPAESGSATITCNPGCAGTRWDVSLAYQQLLTLQRSTTTGLTNTTWLPFGVWESPPSWWLFSYRKLDLDDGVTNCLDAAGQTQYCHSPSGGLVNLAATGVYTSAFGDIDGIPHSHVHPGTFWITNRNSVGVAQ